MINAFYTIYVSDGKNNNLPTVSYNTFESAKASADRQARFNRGVSFYVMVSIGEVKQAEAPIIWKDIAYLPWEETNRPNETF